MLLQPPGQPSGPCPDSDCCNSSISYGPHQILFTLQKNLTFCAYIFMTYLGPIISPFLWLSQANKPGKSLPSVHAWQSLGKEAVGCSDFMLAGQWPHKSKRPVCFHLLQHLGILPWCCQAHGDLSALSCAQPSVKGRRQAYPSIPSRIGEKSTLHVSSEVSPLQGKSVCLQFCRDFERAMAALTRVLNSGSNKWMHAACRRNVIRSNLV